jgi:hypothetical protein
MPLIPSWLAQLPILGLLAVRLIGQETESWGLRTKLDFGAIASNFKRAMSGTNHALGVVKDVGMHGMAWDFGVLEEHEARGGHLVARCVKGRPVTVLRIPRSVGGGRVYRETTGTEVSLVAPEERSDMFSLATPRYPTFLGMNAIAPQLSRYRFRVYRETRKLDPAASLHVPLSAGKLLGWITCFVFVIWLSFASS